ncbi:TPA_asm: protein L [Allium angulosum virus 1]|uniref:protein L n=1 Tax=Allium angulosum virus 1 TaxID=2851934 RepID=UPI00204BF8EC|nr:protein L [Allium angulosum virus 1]DAZ85331.1 TPA_asm: protein L [Allium angulosum virus 1]
MIFSQMDFIHQHGNAVGEAIREDDLKDEPTLGDLHLNSAINLDQIEELLFPGSIKYNVYINNFYKKEWRQMQQKFEKICRMKKIIGWLEPTLMICQDSDLKVPLTMNVFKKIVKLLKDSMGQHGIYNQIVKYADLIISNQVMVRRCHLYSFEVLLRTLCMSTEVSREGRATIYRDVKQVGFFCTSTLNLENGSFSFRLGKNLHALEVMGTNKLYVGNNNSSLLLLDTLGQRLCLEIGCQICDIAQIPGALPEEIYTRILRYGDDILKLIGNDGYEIIGLFEAMVVSCILERNPDPVTSSKEFVSNCENEVTDFCKGRVNGRKVHGMFLEMRNFMKTLADEFLSNIFCMYRIWGHPRVNVPDGMQKVIDKGTIYKEINPQMPIIALHQFRKMFLISYYDKNRQYPPVKLSGDNYVTDCIKRGIPINDRHYAFKLSDFECVEIKQIWTIPETYDICHILNDKAVSPTRSELIENIRKGYGTQCGELRRGLVRWMKSKSIRCAEYLSNIDKNGLDEDSLIIGMYEKEREIKVKARMFSLMSEKMRYYFVLTEEMIANFILPYFPQITMKDSMNVLQKKLWKASGKRSGNVLDPNINIDFEKWNLNMREELTKPLFQQMDLMFGFENCISRTHEMFYKSFIYSSSGSYIPLVMDNLLHGDFPMSYYGHLGGFEGLRQKGWTIVTICILAFIADMLGVKVNLLGQGDNQVVKISMPYSKWESYKASHEEKVTYARELLDRFLVHMEDKFDQAMLPIKTRETWVSCNLFMYGKVMMLSGKTLPQWCKKMLRSYALSNEGTLTISGVIGTIATNMSASAAVSESPDMMYLIFLFLGEWSLNYLLTYHPFTRKSLISVKDEYIWIPGCKQREKKNRVRRIDPSILKMLLLLVPTSCGGSITIPWTSFVFRGFPDHASEGYSWLKMLKGVNSPFRVYLENFYSFLSNSTIEADMLLQSPWSLNHLKPPTPGLQSRDTVREWLLGGTFPDNQFLANMKEIDGSFDRKIIASSMLTDPLNPLISNEIYQTFPHVYLDNVLRRVENTRTIRSLALRNYGNTRVVSKLMKDEHNHNLYIYWRALQRGQIFSDCATEHTRISRDLGWGRKIIGVTTPHPLEYIHDLVCTNGDLKCDGSDYIYVKIDNTGDFAPYLGSTVKTKVISNQDIEARGEPLICVGARVARYANWINLGENYKKLLMKNVSAVCNTSIYDTFMDNDPTGALFSGSVEHRFNPASASEGCFINYAPQLGHKVFMSSDHMPEFGRGSTNVTLHFQAMYSYIQYVDLFKSGRAFYHHHIRCHKCVVPVEDQVPDIENMTEHLEKLYSPELGQVIKDTLGFIEKKTEKILHISAPLSGLRIPLSSINTRHVRESLHLILAFKCAAGLFYRNSYIQSYVDIEDLQKFPRVIAYKICRDRLITLTAKILLCIQSIHLDTPPTLEKIQKIKQLVNKFLSASALTAYQEISSLCLGRNDISKKSMREFEPISPDFPESVPGFLTGVRTSLIMSVDGLNTVRDQTSTMYIPSSFLSQREHVLLLCCLDMMRHGCFSMSSSYTREKKKAKLEYIECRERHLTDLMRAVPLVDTTLERFAKLTGALITRTDPITVKTLNECVGVCYCEEGKLRGYETSKMNFPDWKYHRLFTINFPSKAIYKWDSICEVVRPLKHIIVLGDRSGCISLCFARRFVDSTVYPLSLFDKHMIIPQDLTAMKPILSRNLTNVSSLLQENLPDDILHKDWRECFQKELHRFKPDETLIVSNVSFANENILIQQHVFNSIPEDMSFILRLYYNEMKDWSLCLNYTFSPALLISPLGEIQNGEIFLSGSKSLRKLDNEKYFLDHCIASILKQHPAWCDYRFIYDSIRNIEYNYMEARDVSLNISNTHLIYLGINLPKHVLRLSAVRIITWCLYQMNYRYFPEETKRLTKNKRKLDPLMVDKLTRLMRVILIIAMRDSILFPDWLHRVCITSDPDPNGYIGTHEIKLREVNCQDNLLEERDVACAMTVKNYRCLFTESYIGDYDSYESLWNSELRTDMLDFTDEIGTSTSVTPMFVTGDEEEFYLE